MARTLHCDLCKRPCNEISAKLYYARITPERKRKGFSPHSAYSHHLDVGDCCSERVLGLFNWRERARRAQPEPKPKPKTGAKKRA